jgi:hypothetical protein
MANRSAFIAAVLALTLRSAVIDPSTNEASLGNETYRLPHDSGVRKHLPDRVQNFSSRLYGKRFSVQDYFLITQMSSLNELLLHQFYATTHLVFTSLPKAKRGQNVPKAPPFGGFGRFWLLAERYFSFSKKGYTLARPPTGFTLPNDQLVGELRCQLA